MSKNKEIDSKADAHTEVVTASVGSNSQQLHTSSVCMIFARSSQSVSLAKKFREGNCLLGCCVVWSGKNRCFRRVSGRSPQ